MDLGTGEIPGTQTVLGEKSIDLADQTRIARGLDLGQMCLKQPDRRLRLSLGRISASQVASQEIGGDGFLLRCAILDCGLNFVVVLHPTAKSVKCFDPELA